jgi:hypothetical protein
MALTRSERNKRYRERHGDELRKKDRDRQSGSTHNALRRARYGHATRYPFVGCDGEARNLDNDYHAYFLLRVGNETLWPRDDEVRLRTRDVLSWLCELPRERVYVGYFFDYDVCKILEDLPPAKLKRLVQRHLRVNPHGGWWPVDWLDFELDWFPRKEFKVRRKGGHWITINDVGTFFQSPFVNTLETWKIGTDSQLEMIADGKNQRANFDQVSDEYVDLYNELECVLLAELMEQFRDVCESVGYVPRKWQGPGLLAEAAMAKHGIPKSEDIPILQDTEMDSVVEFARNAYYGPQFETTCVGPTAPCVQFDINSAFPAAMLHLPCLLHGTWKREWGKRKLRQNELSICFAAFRWNPTGKRFMVGSLPIRRGDGSIHFPYNGKGWYWSFELEAAIHQDVTVYDSWTYTSHCNCQPFSFIEDIYQDRLILGKSAKGLILKLLLNSMYGKLVQSVGSPRYANSIWGSFITGWTRKVIAQGIHSLPACKDASNLVPCGYDVFMVASDAIYCKLYEGNQYPGFPSSRVLGEWDSATHPRGLYIVQPGVYFDPFGDSDNVVYKTRGIPKRLVIEYKNKFLDGYRRMLETRNVEDGDVYLPQKLFMGIRQTLQRRDTRLLGQWIEYHDVEDGKKGRRTSYGWTTKRNPQPLNSPSLRSLQSFYSSDFSVEAGIRTIPYWNTHDDTPTGKPIRTTPYSKDIGGLLARAERRLEFEDQPDWVRTE